GMAEGKQDPAKLNADPSGGTLYAALVGDKLELTGPTGYGFAIRGNWSQTIAKTTVSSGAAAMPSAGAAATSGRFGTIRPGPLPLPKPGVTLEASTYTATGPIYLETGVGELELAVPDGQPFTVTTKASTFG